MKEQQNRILHNKVIRVDSKTHQIISKIQRKGGEGNGDVLARIVADYIERNKESL